jgi:NADPH:quinone reductase-like Zn-dependent oxidoreductase
MTLPTTMRAVEITKPGAPEVLVEGTRPVPTPGHGDVLIKLAYAGVNRPDALQRAGNYAPPPTASDLPGLEGAGEVVAVGPGVTGVAIGDMVCALLPGGGYAEYVTTPAAHCLPVPKGLSLKEAACLPETYFTVWSNVFMRGGLKAGERFLVHGGSSGRRRSSLPMSLARGSLPPQARTRSARPAGSWAPMWRSTTARRISSMS